MRQHRHQSDLWWKIIIIIIIIIVSIIILSLMWDSISLSVTCGEGSGAPRRRQRAPKSSVSKKASTRQQEQVFSVEVDKRDLFVDLEHQQVLEKATQNQSKLKKVDLSNTFGWVSTMPHSLKDWQTTKRSDTQPGLSFSLSFSFLVTLFYFHSLIISVTKRGQSEKTFWAAFHSRGYGV